MELKSLLGSWDEMMTVITKQLANFGISETDICDHLCYRVETQERYEELKKELLNFGELAAETMVSGRMISIIDLKKPIIWESFEIKCIELPAPKQGSFYSEGFEHAEFVITELDDFIEKHKELPFNTKAMGREINPELGLKINDKYQVKFHPLHILEVIKKEKDLNIEEVN